MAAVGLQHRHESERELLVLLNDLKRRYKESFHNNNRDNKMDIDNYNTNDLENRCDLYDIISANYVVFALDFILNIRRALHRRQSTMITSIGNSHPTDFTLRIG